MTTPLTETTTVAQLARSFGEAVTSRDYDAMRALFHDELIFRKVSNAVEYGEGADSLVATFQGWIPGENDILSVERIEVEPYADRARVSYKMRVRKPVGGVFVLEQQAYVGERDGLIDHLRVMCGGYRPIQA